jgi:hypothetical protein
MRQLAAVQSIGMHNKPEHKSKEETQPYAAG